MDERDMWHAFQCSGHTGTGLVFDVRVPETVLLETAKCPVCGRECRLRARWEATDRGYGGLGELTAAGEAELLEREARMRVEDFMRKWRALLDAERDVCASGIAALARQRDEAHARAEKKAERERDEARKTCPLLGDRLGSPGIIERAAAVRCLCVEFGPAAAKEPAR